MLDSPTSPDQDIQRLVDEGYSIEIIGGHLLMRNVPYVDAKGNICRGVLGCDLAKAIEKVLPPPNHTVKFSGDFPHTAAGSPLKQIENANINEEMAEGVTALFRFSHKPVGREYEGYHEKLTTYAEIISREARTIDPSISAKGESRLFVSNDNEVFRYSDTASSRSGITSVTKKLKGQSIAIIGLGGTGSYLLDFISKCPVREIHLFDPDRLCQHNAFRAPGAATANEIREHPLKVDYYKSRYDHMHPGILAHSFEVNEGSGAFFNTIDFAFVCIDSGFARSAVIPLLESLNIDFIDVGLGVEEVDGSLLATVRTTMSKIDNRDIARRTIPLGKSDGNGLYDQNIQIAELNALNAIFAIIRWKKNLGYYVDLENEHQTIFNTDGNHLLNEGG